MGFPGGRVVKNPSANAGDMSSIPESERVPGEGNGNPLQYSSLENSMDRGAWRAIVHGVTKSWCNWACAHVCMCVCVFMFLEYLNTSAQEHTEHFLMLTLEKEMATYSSTLAWKITRTENPDRLQSMASQWVRHNWAISLSFFFHFHSHTDMCCGHRYWDFSEVIFLSISKENSSIFHILSLTLHIPDKFSSTASSISPWGLRE